MEWWMWLIAGAVIYFGIGGGMSEIVWRLEKRKGATDAAQSAALVLLLWPIALVAMAVFYLAWPFFDPEGNAITRNARSGKEPREVADSGTPAGERSPDLRIKRMED
jgi:hypothetical protein